MDKAKVEILRETDKALMVRQQRPGRALVVDWIPKSQLGPISKRRNGEGAIEAVIPMPDWLAEEKGLWLE